MSSHVLVDLLGFTGSRGGTETYAREILLRLPALMPDVRFAALTGRVGREEVESFFPGRVHTVPWVGADAATWAAAAVLITDTFGRRHGADLIWAPANFGPILRGVPRLVTVHDAIYDEVPGRLSERVRRAGTSLLMNRSARTADRVVTVSHAAAAAIQQFMGVREDRIDVVHNGSIDPVRLDDPEAALSGLGLPSNRPVILSTGNRMPHKNFRGLLAALATLPRGERPLTVIAGSSLPDPLASDVVRLGLDEDVILPGWVSSEALEALFQIADLYVCPSLAEGFGLPVVDALRRSVPVLANDIPVLREVGGDVAFYGDASDATAFGRAISSALSAAPRPDARDDARRWSAQFTWERSAAGTACSLRSALDSRRGQ